MVMNFEKSLQFENNTKTTSNEDYQTAANILKLNGMDWKAYDTDEDAMAAVQHLVSKNNIDMSTDLTEYPPKIDHDMPMFSQFWYIQSKGKDRTFETKETKSLSQAGGLKNLQQLDDARLMMEAVPTSLTDGPTDAKPGQIVSVKYEELKKEVDSFQKAYLIVALLFVLLAFAVYNAGRSGDSPSPVVRVQETRPLSGTSALETDHILRMASVVCTHCHWGVCMSLAISGLARAL